MPSLVGMTGFIVFETHAVIQTDFLTTGNRGLSPVLAECMSYPRKTLFTPSHAAVDLALLAPGRETRKCYLNGSVLTLHDTWLGCVRGRDNEEWVGETVFSVEGCVHAPAQSLYACGESCTSTVNLDPSHVSSACQAEENVVCNFKCLVAPVSHCCHLDSRSAVTGPEVDLRSAPSFAVYSLLHPSSMPGPPTKSTMDNLTATRQKVGPPSILGAHPTQPLPQADVQLSAHGHVQWDVQPLLEWPLLQAEVSARRILDAEDPTALTELLTNDGQWCDQHFRRVSKMLTMLLRHSDDQQIRLLRRNRIQGDIILIDFLQTDVMKRNFPTLCPASLWAMAHCMTKKRFAFGTVTVTNNFRGDPDFTVGFERYLRDKRVDPCYLLSL